MRLGVRECGQSGEVLVIRGKDAQVGSNCTHHRVQLWQCHGIPSSAVADKGRPHHDLRHEDASFCTGWAEPF